MKPRRKCTKQFLFAFLCMLVLLTGCGMEREDHMEATQCLETSVPQEINTTEETISPSDKVLFHPLIHPTNEDFVRVQDYIPEIITELKYATADNFTGQVIYDFEDVFLRYGTVMKLKAVSEELAEQGLRLKIWDGFRPVSAQFKLWEICPDPTYVANPNKGYSNHSRGFAVDVTLVDSQGREVEMPTGFDDFSAQADRDYSDCTPIQREQAQLLESVMEKHGFSGYQGEWWHFNDTQKYDVEDCFDPGVIDRRYLRQDTPLLKIYWEADSKILQIPSEESVTLLGYMEEYALVEYWGYRGYVPAAVLVK